ncbi:MAG: hypothetical protein M1377_00335 [Deltaproteobacteria bacterium]|nr:hypothetical protein [Deltaproteobacteria bacterium]
MPSSPRGWLCKAVYTLDAQGRTFSPQMDRIRGTGPRYSREEALSVKIIAERASKACTSNGVGYALLMRFYLGEASWWSFTEQEQAILRKTIRHFSKALREAGFLPEEEKEIIP